MEFVLEDKKKRNREALRAIMADVRIEVMESKASYLDNECLYIMSQNTGMVAILPPVGLEQAQVECHTA